MKTSHEEALAPIHAVAPSTSLEIDPYDEHWPSLFRREKIRLLAAIGPWALSIKHIGGTAVPGCASRPAVDMIVGLRTLADAETFCLVALQKLGYRCEPQTDGLDTRSRLFMRGSYLSRRCIRLWMTEKGGAIWQQFLSWRDYLRTHPEAMQAYSNHKQFLATTYADRDQYEKEKYNYIEEAQPVYGIKIGIPT